MYTKPTLASRFLLALYTTLVGYLTFGLLLAYLGYDVISKGSVILHFKMDATAVIPGYFLAGLFVLPYYLASNEFRPVRKFLGGAFAHFLAIFFTMLLLLGTYLLARYGTPDFSQEAGTITAHFLGWGFIIALALSPIGGFAAWIASLFIYRKFQGGHFK